MLVHRTPEVPSVVALGVLAGTASDTAFGMSSVVSGRESAAPYVEAGRVLGCFADTELSSALLWEERRFSPAAQRFLGIKNISVKAVNSISR